MAERRMLAKTIITSDAFTEMPQSTQLLYFYLSMQGDDDGFVNNPKAIMRNAGCKDDDMKILAAKKFIIPFDSGIVVIKHWKIHNYIAKDRYTETKYKEEKASLTLDENGSYTKCIQPVYRLETQDSIGEDSIGEERKEETPDKPAITSKPKRVKKEKEEKNTYGTFKNVFLSDTEYNALKEAYTETVVHAGIEAVSKYVQGNTGKHYSNFNKVMLSWGIEAGKEAIQSGKYKPIQKQKEYVKQEKQVCPKCGKSIEFGQCVDCSIFVGLDGKEVVL